MTNHANNTNDSWEDLLKGLMEETFGIDFSDPRNQARFILIKSVVKKEIERAREEGYEDGKAGRVNNPERMKLKIEYSQEGYQAGYSDGLQKALDVVESHDGLEKFPLHECAIWGSGSQCDCVLSAIAKNIKEEMEK